MSDLEMTKLQEEMKADCESRWKQVISQLSELTTTSEKLLFEAGYYHGRTDGGNFVLNFIRKKL